MPVARSLAMMEGRKPQVDLNAARTVGGRPGALHPSPDGSQLLVFDSISSRVTVLGTAGWDVLRTFELELPSAGEPFFLAGGEDSIYLGGLLGKVAVVDVARGKYAGAIPSVGEACEMKILPRLRQAVLCTAT